MRNVSICVLAKNYTLSNQFVLFVVETYLLETCQASCVELSRVWSRCFVILLCCVVPDCAVLYRFVLCGVVGYGTVLLCVVLCCAVADPSFMISAT